MSAWSSNNPPRSAAPVVRVTELLSEDGVLIAKDGEGKEAVITELAGRLCKRLGIVDGRPIIEKVLERERGISTTLDTGASLPHARVDGITAISAALALIPGGIKDPAQPDLPIRAMFLFFSPNNKDFFAAHLQLLRAVSSLLQPQFIDRLSKASSAREVLEMVRAAEAPKA